MACFSTSRPLFIWIARFFCGLRISILLRHEKSVVFSLCVFVVYILTTMQDEAMEAMNNWWPVDNDSPFLPTTTSTVITTTSDALIPSHSSRYHPNVRVLNPIPTHSHPKVLKKLQPTTIAVDLAHPCCGSQRCSHSNFTIPEAVQFRHTIMANAKEGDILEAIKTQLRFLETNNGSGPAWKLGGKYFQLKVLNKAVCPHRLYVNHTNTTK